MLSDFTDLPVDDATYDRVYAIGSTCYAPDRTQVLRELFRVLKPGGLFIADETVLTHRYEPADQGHRRIREDFLRGYGLPDLITVEECCRSWPVSVPDSRTLRGGRSSGDARHLRRRHPERRATVRCRLPEPADRMPPTGGSGA